MTDTVWLVLVDGGIDVVCATRELAESYAHDISDVYDAEILEVAYKGE